jgi:hypothetical protein
MIAGATGTGGALIWPAILGMAYALLPESRAGSAIFFAVLLRGRHRAHV